MVRLILAAAVTEPATAVSIAAVTFSEPAWRSAARTLAVSACFFTNSRAASGTSMFWSLVNASVTGAKASLTVFSTELVSVVMGVSPSSGLSYGLTPSGLARGEVYVPQLMVRCNIHAASRYHEFVIGSIVRRFAYGTGGMPPAAADKGRRALAIRAIIAGQSSRVAMPKRVRGRGPPQTAGPQEK